MLAAPYLLFGAICGLIYRAHRHAKRAAAAPAAAGETGPGVHSEGPSAAVGERDTGPAATSSELERACSTESVGSCNSRDS
jgi:hypothetical protein